MEAWWNLEIWPWDLIRLRISPEWSLALWQWFEEGNGLCNVDATSNDGMIITKSFDGSNGKPKKMNAMKKHWVLGYKDLGSKCFRTSICNVGKLWSKLRV